MSCRKTQYYETGYPFIQERFPCIKNSEGRANDNRVRPGYLCIFSLYHKIMTQSRANADLQGT